MSIVRFAKQCGVAAVILMAAACQSNTQPKAKSPFVQVTGALPAGPKPPGETIGMDPCIDQMQDVCGALLYFYRVNKRLPNTLDELSAAAGQFLGPLELTCPTSKKPYLLDRDGFVVPNNPGRAFIYDAEPCHARMRFVILVEEKERVLVARPVAVAESDLPDRIKATR